MPPLVRGAQVSRVYPWDRSMPRQPQTTVHLARMTISSTQAGIPSLPYTSLHCPSLSCPHPTPQQIHNIRQHSSTGPPPLLLAPRASVPNVQIQGQRIIQQGLIRVANVPNTSLLVNIPQVRAMLCQHGECAMQLPLKGPTVLGHSGVVRCDLPAPSEPGEGLDTPCGLYLSSFRQESRVQICHTAEVESC